MDFEQTLMLGHNLLVCTKWSKLTLIVLLLILDYYCYLSCYY